MDNPTLVLGSKSPRRQTLVKELGFPVEIRIQEVDEVYPDSISPRDVPAYLAKLKAQPLLSTLSTTEILLTSDTIVLLDGEVIGKPSSEEDAIHMLTKLSGKKHEVITGVYLGSLEKKIVFSVVTEVYFAELTEEEIGLYVRSHQPMDKAGSYAIQEWIGFIGVKRIEGCYYNVMGLPLSRVYSELKLNFLG